LDHTKESAINNDPISIDNENTSIDIDTSDIVLDATNISEEETEKIINNQELMSFVSSDKSITTHGEKSTDGALDRLTAEIIANAESKNLNVAWLLDASISLTHQRQSIYNRLENILKEIESIGSANTIKHCICKYGKDITFLTETPTDNIDFLKQNIASISIDESGIENTFNAVLETSKRYYVRNSRLMIIVFTDEVGDDIHLLEKVSFFARSRGCVVYVVGSPAPFGKAKTQFKYIDPDPDYDQKEKWVEIQQGPETLFPMLLNIRALPEDDECLDSGFGPFGLCCLCYDTGGLYFSVHSDRSDKKLNMNDISPLSSKITKFFDSDVMFKYKPDYRSQSQQIQEANNHKIKSALLKACSISLDITSDQTRNFRAFTESDFVEAINEAQKFSAKIEPKINEIYNILISYEKDIHTLRDSRWEASYHLAMARILSTKFRVELYNHTLAEAKLGLKKKLPNTNAWSLENSYKLSTLNSQLNKNYEKALYHLKYIIANYPDTPWAYIANYEIKTPFGYEWKENYVKPPKMNNGGNNNLNTPKDDTIKKLQPKPQRKIEKI
jgi:hypothetical protein